MRITPKGARWNGTVRMVPEHLADPLRWRKPRRIFVNSMSDLFHEALTNEQIAAVFGVMAAAPQHTFQVLTKRAKRMREYLQVDQRAEWSSALARHHLAGEHPDMLCDQIQFGDRVLPNVWLGVSVENQAAADERVPDLIRTPAAVRFLSCEPLLGGVILQGDEPPPALHSRSYLRGVTGDERINWVIGGCESGPGARDCDVAWLRSLRDQCAAAAVPFFLKQAVSANPFNAAMHSVGIGAGGGSKRKAGGVIELPYLDGVQHAAFPELQHG